jgi:hypothetical protein
MPGPAQFRLGAQGPRRSVSRRFADTDRKVADPARRGPAHIERVSAVAELSRRGPPRQDGHHGDMAEPKDLTDNEIVELYLAWCEAENAQNSTRRCAVPGR